MILRFRGALPVAEACTPRRSRRPAAERLPRGRRVLTSPRRLGAPPQDGLVQAAAPLEVPQAVRGIQIRTPRLVAKLVLWIGILGRDFISLHSWLMPSSATSLTVFPAVLLFVSAGSHPGGTWLWARASWRVGSGCSPGRPRPGPGLPAHG